MSISRVAAAFAAAAFDFGPVSLADTIWAAAHLDFAPAAEAKEQLAEPMAPNGVVLHAPNTGPNEDLDADESPAGKTAARPASPSKSVPAQLGSTGQHAAPVFGSPDPNASRSSGIRVSPVRIPAGAALPNGLEIVRALRAIPARRPSRTQVELDTNATVEATAENNGQLTVRVSPVAERWFDISIVVELTPSVEMWSDTVVEVERLLNYTGIFRDVRVQYLDCSSEPRLVLRGGQTAPLKTLCDPNGRRIVLLFGTGITRAWTDGTMGEALAVWSRVIPVALLHALPESMWRQTRLGRPPAIAEAAAIGAPNELLAHRPAYWARWLDLDTTRLLLPVIALEPNSVKRWSEFIAQRRQGSTKAFLVPLRAHAKSASGYTANEPAASAPAVDVETRVKHLAASSPRAYRIASILSATPFPLSLARLIHTALYGPTSDNLALAELMLSGLVERIPDDRAEAIFRFIAPAAKLLIGVLRVDDVREVSDYLARYLRSAGATGGEARAYYRDERGAEYLPPDTKPFAELHTSLIAMLVGESRPAVTGTTLPTSVVDPFVTAREAVYGRDRDVLLVDDALRARHVVAIVGPAGIGKSTLARAVARIVRPRYDIIWCLDAGSETSLVRSIAALRRAVRGTIDMSPQLGIDQFHALWADLGRTQSAVLLIVDDLPFALAQEIFALDIAFSERCSALLTTRANRKIPDNVAVHRLAKLEPADAFRFIEAESARRDIDAQELPNLAQLVGTSPAALRFVALALRHSGAHLRPYAERIRMSLGPGPVSTRAESRTTAALCELVRVADDFVPGAKAVFLTLCCFGNDLVPRFLLEARPVFGFERSGPLQSGEAAESSALASSQLGHGAPRLVGQRQLDATGLEAALIILARIGIVALETPATYRMPRYAAQLIRDALYAQRIPWWREALGRLSDAYGTAAEHRHQLDLLPIAAFILNESGTHELHPKTRHRNTASLANRTQTAIDCGQFALLCGEMALADDFARHADAALKCIAALGQPNPSLEYAYKELRAKIKSAKIKSGKRHQPRVAERVAEIPAAVAAPTLPPSPNKPLTDDQVRMIARSELETNELRIISLVSTRKRQTWIAGGAGSVIHIAHDRNAGDGKVVWRSKSPLAMPVRALPNRGIIRIGRNRDLPYSPSLHPDSRALVKAIQRLILEAYPPHQAPATATAKVRSERSQPFTFQMAELEASESIRAAHITIGASPSRVVVAQTMRDTAFEAAFLECLSTLDNNSLVYPVAAAVSSGQMRRANFVSRETRWHILFLVHDPDEVHIVLVAPDDLAARGPRPAAPVPESLRRRSRSLEDDFSPDTGSAAVDRWRVLIGYSAQLSIVALLRESAFSTSVLKTTIAQLERDPLNFPSSPDDRTLRIAAVGDRFAASIATDRETMDATIVRLFPVDDDGVESAVNEPVVYNLGNRRDVLGQREAALAAAEKAVAIQRELAASRLDAFQPDVASSLNRLAIRLDALGQSEAALAATEEAMAIYRELAASRPDAFRPDLASSLNNLGIRLDALGQREAALAATEEAAAIYRELAASRPDPFRPALAGSLNNLGALLNALGQRKAALAATEEAAAIYRELSKSRPDVLSELQIRT